MPATPWKTRGSTEPDREYVVVATYIPVRRIVRIPQFWWSVLKIRRQLNRSEGLVGFMLLAKVFQSDYWTLSVWENEEAAGRFAEAEPHRTIGSRITTFVKSGFKVVRWTATGRELPPTWDAAFGHLSSPDET